jgi:mycoredoxin
MKNIRRIIFYGTKGCPDCIRSKYFLDTHGVSYAYIDIEKNKKGGLQVLRLNNGYRSVPTIVFPDGTVLTEPKDADLQHTIADMETHSLKKA